MGESALRKRSETFPNITNVSLTHNRGDTNKKAKWVSSIRHQYNLTLDSDVNGVTWTRTATRTGLRSDQIRPQPNERDRHVLRAYSASNRRDALTNMTRAIKGRSRTVTTEGGSEGSSEEEPPKKGVAKRYELRQLTKSELDMLTVL
jgi:hypothetical protein